MQEWVRSQVLLHIRVVVKDNEQTTPSTVENVNTKVNVSEREVDESEAVVVDEGIISDSSVPEHQPIDDKMLP